MNKLYIIGNVTKAPECRVTRDGVNVCTFTVAVNGKGKEDVRYFRTTAWRGLAEVCEKYLAKGRKVAVIGSVGLSEYQGKDGTNHASLEVTADEVEFLTAKQDTQGSGYTSSRPTVDELQQAGFAEIEGNDLPF